MPQVSQDASVVTTSSIRNILYYLALCAVKCDTINTLNTTGARYADLTFQKVHFHDGVTRTR